MLTWLLISVHRGEIYLPNRNGPVQLYRLWEDPDSFWFAIKIPAALTIFFLLGSVVHSPALDAWNRRMDRQMRHERENAVKRSILWQIAVYGVLPIGIVVGLFSLAVYVGATNNSFKPNPLPSFKTPSGFSGGSA